MIKLRNMTRTMLVFNVVGLSDLTHTIDVTSTQKTPDGLIGVRRTKRTVPASITLLAQETCEFPDGVESSPEVKAALATGAIRLIR